jgi:hypothetical protein
LECIRELSVRVGARHFRRGSARREKALAGFNPLEREQVEAA